MLAPANLPTIGAVIPAFNGARHLDETIRSVLAQTVPVTELVVVDDGSTDDSAAVAAVFPNVRVIRQANAGQAAAFNRGVADLTSEFVAFLDQDDLWTPDRLARQLPCFTEPTPPDLV